VRTPGLLRLPNSSTRRSIGVADFQAVRQRRHYRFAQFCRSGACSVASFYQMATQLSKPNQQQNVVARVYRVRSDAPRGGAKTCRTGVSADDSILNCPARADRLAWTRMPGQAFCTFLPQRDRPANCFRLQHCGSIMIAVASRKFRHLRLTRKPTDMRKKSFKVSPGNRDAASYFRGDFSFFRGTCSCSSIRKSVTLSRF